VSVELRMLTFSVVLGIVQIIAASHAASLQRGYGWTASPRDEKVEPLSGVAGRLKRALRNFSETSPLFVAVVLIAQLTDTHDALTEWGGQALFLGARCLRAAVRGRGPFAPFAGMERRHDRHRVGRRRRALGVVVVVVAEDIRSRGKIVTYRARTSACAGCSLKPRCTTNKNGRSLRRSPKDE
jgi:uncharacterized MAPEG superfamily protein